MNTKTQNAVNAIFNAVNASLDSRILNADNDNAKRELKQAKQLFSVHLATVMYSEKIDVENVASIIALNDKNNDNFFAQKALIKYFKLLKTLSQNIDNLDRYTRNYITSMLLLKDSATNEQIQKGMSKAIALNDTELSLRANQLHIATSTSSTQASSTRKMLQYANLISYDSKSKMQAFKDSATRDRLATIVKFA
ncbi:hypothetical protein UFOVP26_57 [uncultured Caudovirales phage]|uniref:Uncharacterized protein n=1 Tax=uncultured Caudovirales phage TaxID=2100421 RepID=A0A6J7WLV9_9CAUD|nr:hypothetical protein UFOVP26_57 [uncultured Caudovirales phage]CAB4123714.1 hypothetical protein UFOVP44_40 [uncultured Caudovirales phage]CAB5219081.1 hypothetical protein UFOVP220_31 [uncultured Caudovirales phage]